MSRPARLRALPLLGLSVLILGCPAPPDPADRVFELADRYVEAYFEAFPEEATYLGLPDAPHDRLSDLSAEARAAWQAAEDSLLEELEAIDVTGLDAGHPAAITHGFLSTVLRNAQDYRICRLELWNVSPTWTGWPSRLGRLASSQPVETEQQRRTARRRLAEVPRFLDQEIANLRDGLERGYTAPRNNVEAVIRQVEALVEAPSADSPFLAMAPEGADDFRAALEELEDQTIRPAIRRYRDFLTVEYLPAAREAIGVAANPDGEACYAAAVRYWATVDVPSEEIHRIGLDHMSAIRAEMLEIAERSFGTDDVDALLERLRSDPEHLVGGRDEMLRIAREAVERAEAAVPDWFGRLPQAAVEVRPVPAFEEEGAPFAYYNSPAEDGSRPGVYFINLHEAETKPRAGVEATTFHEAYPGHHLQIALAMERDGLHPVQRYVYLSGFGEGWALYTERLADEIGLYDGDVDRMGMLSNEALRAARLVVDSGMHMLGWSRGEAVDYMLANTAEARSTVSAEVDRYLAAPGQATAYLLGSLEILRLREEARQALGERFELRAFHDRVLEDGAVPLDMLRAKIERWIE